MAEDAKVPLGSITNRLGKRRSEPFKNSHTAETPSGKRTATLPRYSMLLSPCNNCIGQDEYIKSLQSALREVAEENEVLRERVIELEALFTQIEESIQATDLALAQLCRKPRSKLVV